MMGLEGTGCLSARILNLDGKGKLPGGGAVQSPAPGPASVSVQLLSRVQLYDPMDCSLPGFPVLQCLPEFAQTQVH